MKRTEPVAIASLERLFIEVIDQEGGREYKDFFRTRSREGIFSPALVMWLMVCLRLQERKSLMGALESLAAGDCDHVLAKNEGSKRRRGNVSMNSGGLSRARSRLKLDDVRAVAELTSRRLMGRYVGSDGLWRGKRAYLIDGTLIALGTGEAIREKYRGVTTEYCESKTGMLLCLCFHELFSGVALSPEFGPYRGNDATSEQALARQMIGKLRESALLLGDRNFGVFSVAYEAQRSGHDVLFRLTKPRAEAVCGKALSTRSVDEEVTWTPGAAYFAEHPELSSEAAVKGRFIQATIKNPGCKPFKLYLFTTSDAPKSELVALYKERTRIEHDIRSLKYTLGLEMLYGQTPDIVEKELLLGVAAYNLLRAVIAWGARKLRLKPRDISFSRAAALTQIFGNQMRDAQTTQEQQEITRRYLKALEQSKLPHRAAYRVEPRMVTRKRQQMPLMKTSRKEARKQARKVLRQYGHRSLVTRKPSALPRYERM